MGEGRDKDPEDSPSDAQTSGGLLIAVPAARSRKLLKRLNEAGVTEAVEIGGIVADKSAMIRIV